MSTRRNIERLDLQFLAALIDIGELGAVYHEKHHYQDVPRRLDRDPILHARDHIDDYVSSKVHELGEREYHLAAAAFNLMMEFHWLRKEKRDASN